MTRFDLRKFDQWLTTEPEIEDAIAAEMEEATKADYYYDMDKHAGVVCEAKSN